jgi:hypothetical protein
MGEEAEEETRSGARRATEADRNRGRDRNRGGGGGGGGVRGAREEPSQPWRDPTSEDWFEDSGAGGSAGGGTGAGACGGAGSSRQPREAAEEECSGSSSEEESEVEPEDGDAESEVEGKGGGQQNEYDVREYDKCYKCGVRGHWSADCPAPRVYLHCPYSQREDAKARE